MRSTGFAQELFGAVRKALSRSRSSLINKDIKANLSELYVSLWSLPPSLYINNTGFTAKKK